MSQELWFAERGDLVLFVVFKVAELTLYMPLAIVISLRMIMILEEKAHMSAIVYSLGDELNMPRYFTDTFATCS